MKRIRVATAATLLLGGFGYLILTAASVEGIVYKPANEIRAEAHPGKQYRLMGKAKPGSVVKEPSMRSIEFTVVDEQGAEMRVVYEGIVPDTFRDGADVVISGPYAVETDRIVATELQAKCPSKYQGQFNPNLSDSVPHA